MTRISPSANQTCNASDGCFWHIPGGTGDFTATICSPQCWTPPPMDGGKADDATHSHSWRTDCGAGFG